MFCEALHQKLVRPAHQPEIDDRPVFMAGKHPRRYAIHLRGALGNTIASAFPELELTRSAGDTVLTGVIADQAALYGLLRQLEELGVELVALHPLPSSSERWRC